MKYHCKYCGRYIMDIEGTTIIENLICPNSKCKAHLNVKVITPQSTLEEINYRFKTIPIRSRNMKLHAKKIVPPKDES